MPLPERTPDLATLDLLASVAESGSLGRAADLHRISQPAASQRLQRLERQLGLHLLLRTPNGSRLTPDGEAVLAWARPVLESAHQLSVAVQALKNRAPDVLQVGASLTLSDYLFPRWLGALHRRMPAVRVALRVGNSAAVAALVHAGQVDLGFTEGPQPPPGLRYRAVGGDRLVVVIAPTHPWARRRRPLPVAALAAEPLAVREVGSGTREALEQALAEAGLTLRPAVELGSTAALKLAAMGGEGPAVLSELSVTDELADGRLRAVAVRDLDLRRRFHGVWHPDRPPSGAAATLLALASRPPARRSASPPP